MDTALETVLSWHFSLFCLAISAATYVIRTVVDYYFIKFGKVAKENPFWSKLILPVLPILLGCLGAIVAKQYPFPQEITSFSGRMVFGLCAGLLSGFIFKWVKSVINIKSSNEEKKTE
jgi:hypothetical protein